MTHSLRDAVFILSCEIGAAEVVLIKWFMFIDEVNVQYLHSQHPQFHHI